MYPHPGRGRAIGKLFWLLSVAAAVSFWFRNDFAEPEVRAAALQQMDLEINQGVPAEPNQWAINAPAFDVEREGINYTVSPLYDYALQGVVVSLKAHDANYGLHRLWGDHLNIADVCVVWGQNAASLDLNGFDFWNGQFTCNVETRSGELWKQFRMDQLSNNHLLVDDESVRARLSELEIGQVVAIRGQLAEYANDSGHQRGTSTVRTDTGNGACETVYVEDVRVAGDVHTFWNPLFWFSLWGTLLVGLVWVYGVGRGHY